MNIEDQVCTLEQSKRLKELGSKQHSLFAYWIKNHNKLSRLKIAEYTDNIFYSIHAEEGNDFNAIMGRVDEFACAYTVAELGEMLKDWNNSHQHNDNLMPRYYNDGILDWWHCDEFQTNLATTHTEAQARAAMLIYLLENKLITWNQ